MGGVAANEGICIAGHGRPDGSGAEVTIQLEPYGFWSYARKDDEFTDQKVSQLHDHIHKELELDYGDPLILFRDTSDITTGAEWERMITGAIAKSSFLIPVITPTFLKRPWCMHEVRLFLEREDELCRRHPELAQQGMIFPIGYREIRDAEALDSDIMAALRKRQWIKIERLRGRSFSDPELSAEIGKLLLSVRKLLHIEIESEEERSARLADEQASALAAEESKRLADEERRRELTMAEEKRRAREAGAETVRAEAATDLLRKQQLKAEQEQKDRERHANARRDAAAKRAAHWARWQKGLRLYALPVTAGVLLLVVVTAIAVLLFRPRAAEPANDQVASDNGSAETRNEIDNAVNNAFAGPRLPPPLPVHNWLYDRWGIEGDCSNTISIAGTETTFTITTSFRSSPRRILGEPTGQSVQTDQGIYTLQPDGSMRSSETDMQGLRLTRCSPQTGAAGM